jgi:hypothetical protein
MSSELLGNNERAPPPSRRSSPSSSASPTSIGSESSLFRSFPSRRDGPRNTTESGDDDGDEQGVVVVVEDKDDDEGDLASHGSSVSSIDRFGFALTSAADAGDEHEDEVEEKGGRHFPPPPPPPSRPADDDDDEGRRAAVGPPEALLDASGVYFTAVADMVPYKREAEWACGSLWKEDERVRERTKRRFMPKNNQETAPVAGSDVAAQAEQ